MNKKNLKILIISIVAIIAIIITILFATLFLFKDDPRKFYGDWEVNFLGLDSSPGYWSFYENGSMRLISYSVASSDGNVPNIDFEKYDDNKITVVSSGIKTEWGSYKVEGGKLYLSGLSDFSGSIGISYNFIGDNELQINVILFTVTLTKISESEINIDPEYQEIPWENVNISLFSYPSENYNWINLTRSSTSYYGEHAPSEWGIIQKGDIIEIGDYEESISVWLTWIPTDSYIEFISFD
jgi:hypothetical protein